MPAFDDAFDDGADPRDVSFLLGVPNLTRALARYPDQFINKVLALGLLPRQSVRPVSCPTLSDALDRILQLVGMLLL